MIILDVRCTHQLFVGGTSFDFGDIDIGTIGKIDTGDTVWQVNSWFKFMQRGLVSVCSYP